MLKITKGLKVEETGLLHEFEKLTDRYGPYSAITKLDESQRTQELIDYMKSDKKYHDSLYTTEYYEIYEKFHDQEWIDKTIEMYIHDKSIYRLYNTLQETKWWNSELEEKLKSSLKYLCPEKYVKHYIDSIDQVEFMGMFYDGIKDKIRILNEYPKFLNKEVFDYVLKMGLNKTTLLETFRGSKFMTTKIFSDILKRGNNIENPCDHDSENVYTVKYALEDVYDDYWTEDLLKIYVNRVLSISGWNTSNRDKVYLPKLIKLMKKYNINTDQITAKNKVALTLLTASGRIVHSANLVDSGGCDYPHNQMLIKNRALLFKSYVEEEKKENYDWQPKVDTNKNWNSIRKIEFHNNPEVISLRNIPKNVKNIDIPKSAIEIEIGSTVTNVPYIINQITLTGKKLRNYEICKVVLNDDFIVPLHVTEIEIRDSYIKGKIVLHSKLKKVTIIGQVYCYDFVNEAKAEVIKNPHNNSEIRIVNKSEMKIVVDNAMNLEK